jgi:RNA polymerase sigma-70 factor (ECF subfamily)
VAVRPDQVGRYPWDAQLAAHDRRVILLLLAMGLRLDQAKDIAQRTWLRLIEQYDAGQLPRVELPGLALRQARFLALDELRRQGKNTKLAVVEVEVESGLPSQETALIRREELASALRAFDRCTPSAQRVFQAVYEAPESSHADAAAKLGLSVQRVRQVLCEVRRKLRAAMEASEVNDER